MENVSTRICSSPLYMSDFKQFSIYVLIITEPCTKMQYCTFTWEFIFSGQLVHEQSDYLVVLLIKLGTEHFRNQYCIQIFFTLENRFESYEQHAVP